MGGSPYQVCGFGHFILTIYTYLFVVVFGWFEDGIPIAKRQNR